MSGFRTHSGGRTSRDHPLHFTFDGKPLSGFAGDTIASALLANGISVLGRSFKYHRARGALTLGAGDPNALVSLRTGGRLEPNCVATVAELFDGLVCTSQNRWPSLAFDIGAVNQLLSPFLTAGFYYKTFMWPPAFWEKLYEPIIRRAAGLGTASLLPDPDRYEKANAHCDLLVIGGGPAGLSAALSAAGAGARVILADDGSLLGGSLLSDYDHERALEVEALRLRLVAELEAAPQVRVMTRTTVCARYDGNTFAALERVADHQPAPPPHQPRQRFWRLHAKVAVLATGAEERAIAFAGNDTPGVMLASAVRGFLNRYGVAVGARTLVFANNDSGAHTVRALQDAGLEVAALVDSRPQAAGGAQVAGVRTLHEAVVIEARGRKRVRSASVRTAGGATETFAVDTLAVSGGYNPRLQLACHLGDAPVWNEAIAAFIPPSLGAAFAPAGAAGGTLGSAAACAAEGHRLGEAAARTCGFTPSTSPPPDFTPLAAPPPAPLSPLWRVKGGRGKSFVDYQNDVIAQDIELAAHEGYRHIELTKRYTTLGMATDQGRFSGTLGAALLAEALGKSVAEVGVSRIRPFQTPIAFGAMAGPHTRGHFQPVRKTPTHAWATSVGAVFIEAGLWMRAQWFPLAHETDWQATVSREVRAVRTSLGVCDVSTLGKIELQGPDTAALLNKLYCNGWAKLAVGKARYGLMLREDGIVFDDGTTSRLAEHKFLMTTTTAQAAPVLAHIEFHHRAFWPELDVQYASVTEQWGQLAIAGPNARACLKKITDDFVLNDETFPYLAAAEIHVCGGIPARLFRISFSGEHAYELAVPADYTQAVLEAILHAGAEFDITPYGTEALSVMRIEKGHVAGSELNGTTTARDLGLGAMLSTKKDYIGRALGNREGMQDPHRAQLIGIRACDAGVRLLPGGYILESGDAPSLEAAQGYITAAALSPSLGRWVGLALVKRGSERAGERVQVWDSLRDHYHEAELCPPIHFDPKGERLHA